MHRLQRLRLALGDGRPADLVHAERDLGRGVPARLAPGAIQPAANADNDVLVVGAGPAGMECAMVLGKRGMRRVHLVDGRAESGGHLRWVTSCPASATWARVIQYRGARSRS